MKGKILFVAGLATGYVLGSKAGRQAYERIKSQASGIWESPAVQKTVSQAGTLAKETASTAQSKVSSALGHATEAVSTDSTSNDSGTSTSSASAENSSGGDTPGSDTPTGGYV